MHLPFQKPAHSTPKDVFQHLLMIVTLYISVVSLIALLSNYIDVLFPDLLNNDYQGTLDGIRMSSSTLLVVVPVFIPMSWLIHKEFVQEPEKHEMKIRKWLVYLTLFIASITIIIDLIRLIYNFYSGDLTTKFLLKVVVVLLVTGAVFGYYFWDLKGNSLKSKMPKTFAWGVSGVVLISIIAGFFIVGSPMKQREIRFDEQRVTDLQNIQNSLINFWTQKDKLPDNLDSLRDSISGFVPPVDPETGKPYDFKIVSPLSFNLCADFHWPSLDQSFGASKGGVSPTPVYPMGYYGGGADQNWSHQGGSQCFSRTIDPTLYKPAKP
jgi:Domain of unknown function (DUF5671)